jgi:hypothetical protein
LVWAAVFGVWDELVHVIAVGRSPAATSISRARVLSDAARGRSALAALLTTQHNKTSEIVMAAEPAENNRGRIQLTFAGVLQE